MKYPSKDRVGVTILGRVSAKWLRVAWGVAILGCLQTAAVAQTPGVFSSFHVVDMRDRGESRAPVITAVAMHTGKNVLALAGDDHRIRLMGSGGDQPLTTWVSEGWVYDLAFDPAGNYLAAVDEWGALCLWHWQTGRRLYRLPVSSAALRDVAFHPGGQMLAAAGFEPRVVLVETTSGRVLRQLPAARDLRDVAFSPDGQYVATTGGSGRIQMWEVQTGRLMKDVAVSNRRQHALGFAPDGQSVAVGGEDGVIRIVAMQPEQPRILSQFALEDGQVTSLTFCNDGRAIAAGTSRNDIRVFELNTQREIARLRGHTGTVARLVWTPGQDVLASGSFDTTIRFWRLPAETTVGERPGLPTGTTLRQ